MSSSPAHDDRTAAAMATTAGEQQNDFFPTIGNAVGKEDDDDFAPVDQIESLCMECHEQVSTASGSCGTRAWQLIDLVYGRA
jgi:hypothetical protein